MRESFRNRKLDRSDWPAGPWDNEPDFYEWTTTAGYPAYAGRLDIGNSVGCWVGVVIAPHPIDGEGSMLLAFLHTMREKARGRLCPGMIWKTDKEDVGEFTYSMEHYQNPTSTSPMWGPYKTLEDVKQHCEDAANLILKTHEEGTYVNYFQPRKKKDK